MFVQHHVGSEQAKRALPSSMSESVSQVGVVYDPGHAGRQPAHVPWRKLQASAAYNFPKAADIRRNDEPALHHLFDGNQPECLFPHRRNDDSRNVRQRVRECLPASGPNEVDLVRQSVCVSHRFESCSLRAFADYCYAKRVTTVAEATSRLDEHRKALLTDEASHERKADWLPCASCIMPGLPTFALRGDAVIEHHRPR
jgi:hypothetical protein